MKTNIETSWNFGPSTGRKIRIRANWQMEQVSKTAVKLNTDIGDNNCNKIKMIIEIGCRIWT